MLAALVLTGYGISVAWRSATGWVAGSLPHIQSTSSTTLTSALGELRAKGGLQIGWRTIDTAVEVDRTTTVDAFGFSVPLGSVHIRIDVPGNRVQYVVPVDPTWTIRAVDAETFIVTIPPPIVNKDVVEVQSDPAKFRVFIDNDWAEHLIPSGGDVDSAKALVRASVIETGSSRPALAEVRMEARSVAAGFVGGVLAAGRGGNPRVIVEFSDESTASDAPPR